MPKQVVLYPSYDKDHPLGLGLSLHWGADSAQWCFNFNVPEMHKLLTALMENPKADPRSIVFTEELTREDLQQTVRAARRARDARYGSDE